MLSSDLSTSRRLLTSHLGQCIGPSICQPNNKICLGFEEGLMYCYGSSEECLFNQNDCETDVDCAKYTIGDPEKFIVWRRGCDTEPSGWRYDGCSCASPHQHDANLTQTLAPSISPITGSPTASNSFIQPSAFPTSAPPNNQTMNTTLFINTTVGNVTTTDSPINIAGHILSNLEKLNQDILAGSMFIGSVFLIFFGGKHFNKIIFLVGFTATGYGVYVLCAEPSFGFDSDTRLYVSLGVGVLGGGILAYAHKLSIFAFGAVSGTILFQFVYIHVETYTSFDPEYYQYVLIACGWSVLCGYVVYKFWMYLMKFMTSFLGGFMFASSVSYAIKRAQRQEEGVFDVLEYFDYRNTSCEDEYCYGLAGTWLTMFLVGITFQYELSKKYKKCCGGHPKDDGRQLSLREKDQLDRIRDLESHVQLVEQRAVHQQQRMQMLGRQQPPNGGGILQPGSFRGQKRLSNKRDPRQRDGAALYSL